MKKILSLLGLFAFCMGCSQEEFSVSENPQDHEPNAVTRTPGDCLYDALGFGLDATGEITLDGYVRQQVVDVDKFLLQYPTRISSEQLNTREGNTVLGQDCEEFYNKLQIDGSVKFPKLFSGELTYKYTTEDIQKTDQSFASHSEMIKLRRHTLNLPVQLPSAAFNPFLNPNFLNDLNTKSAQQLVMDYGTHVLLGVTLGGNFHVNYKSKITHVEKKKSLECGVSVSLGKIFSITNNYQQDENYARNCTDVSLFYKSIGGNPNARLNGSIYPSESASVDISEWIASVNAENMVLIEVPQYSLIQLDQFISDPAKRSVVKTFIDEYIASKNIRPSYNIYRYYSDKEKNDLITSDWSEFGYGGGEGYNYIKTEGLFISPYDESNQKTPLYRYQCNGLVAPITKNTYYTIIHKGSRFRLSEIMSKIDKYDTYDYVNICGYVYKNMVQGSIPLYQYVEYHSGSIAPFYNIAYTTDLNEYMTKKIRDELNLNKIICYVLPINSN